MSSTFNSYWFGSGFKFVTRHFAGLLQFVRGQPGRAGCSTHPEHHALILYSAPLGEIEAVAWFGTLFVPVGLK